jgi:diguanylate cyclase (GGDEF)-like protein/PAS domain S-box-containing protein
MSEVTAQRDHFFAGEGEMAARMRAHDWNETSLGPYRSWPQSLKATIRMVLISKVPMCLSWGPNLNCLYNDAYAEFIGTRHPLALGRPLAEHLPEIWPDLRPLVERTLAGEATFTENQKLVVAHKGYEEEVYFTFSHIPVHDEAGAVSGMLCMCTDTTHQVLAEKRLSSVLDSTTDSVIVLDHDWRITYMNQRANALVGTGRNLDVGVRLWDAFPDEVGSIFDQQYRRAIDSQTPIVFEAFHPAQNLWLEVHAYPTPDALSIFFRDITERRKTQEQLHHLAHHDPLTNLANRSLFYHQLDKAMEGIWAGSQVAVLYFDLDHFKEVNDVLGHPMGDALLVNIAQRLRACVRETDTVARLGGDEFAVIQVGLNGRHEPSVLAQRIIERLTAPYQVKGELIRTGVSVGIALAPGDGLDSADLFKNADIALYQAKAEGRGTYCFFEPALEKRLLVRQALKSDLAKAVTSSQFELVFQPTVKLRTNNICGFEALLRWQHPDRGLILPAEFIPIAEETGLIIPIGDWVLEQACAEAVKWPREIRVAVNLSPAQFSQDLPAKVARALARNGLSAERLELEITESVLLQDSEPNLSILHALRELGVRTVLDDFGTGYSSLSYLQKFPFSKIKIDRSFISELPEKEEAKAIVRAVTHLGHSLRMLIVAEGVETQQQLDWLRMRSCDGAQGYFFSKPVGAEEIDDCLKRLNAGQIS